MLIIRVTVHVDSFELYVNAKKAPADVSPVHHAIPANLRMDADIVLSVVWSDGRLYKRPSAYSPNQFLKAQSGLDIMYSPAFQKNSAWAWVLVVVWQDAAAVSAQRTDRGRWVI